MQRDITLCAPDCQKFHTRAFVCEQLGISETTFYRWSRDGLRVSRKGMVFCKWIREYCETERENTE